MDKHEKSDLHKESVLKHSAYISETDVGVHTVKKGVLTQHQGVKYTGVTSISGHPGYTRESAQHHKE